MLLSLSLLHVFTVTAGLAVVKLTPARHLSPQPPSVAERDVVQAPASGAVPALDPNAGPLPDASTVTGRLSAIIGGPGAKTNAVVIDVATRRPLFDRHANVPATPASTTKLVTSVAALAALGPAHRITTQVVEGGYGRIVLVGGGDPTLTALPARPEAGHPPWASLLELAQQTASALKSSGVQQVRVDYDVSAYAGPRTAVGWKPNYIPDGEVAPVSALTVDEGRVSPADPSKRTRVSDPPAAAVRQFARLLSKNGVKAMPGKETLAPRGAERIAAVQSPPLSALVEHLMTESDNDLAEAVARQVAINKGRTGTFTDAAQAVMQVLAGLGVSQGISLYDGSGLSTRNRITPLALAKLVALAASEDHPRLRPAITGMPVAGFSGTLTSRFASAASQAGVGMVRAKTGTLAGVSTLAGIAHDADGRLLAFAFMAGDGKGAVDPGKLDLLAAALAACGCGGAPPIGG